MGGENESTTVFVATKGTSYGINCVATNLEQVFLVRKKIGTNELNAMNDGMNVVNWVCKFVM